MTDAEFLQKLREAFAIEAAEHVQAIIAGLIELEAGPPEARKPEIIETIFRDAHSLKGAARAVSRSDIETVCQSLESIFSQWKRKPVAVEPETFDTLNAAADLVEKLLKLPSDTQTPSQKSEILEMVRRLNRPASAATRPAAPPAATPKEQPGPAAVVPADAPLAAPPLPPAPPPQVTPAAQAPIPPPAPPPASEPEKLHVADTVRIPLAKMDALLLQAEEMIAVKLSAANHLSALRKLDHMLEEWRGEWLKIREIAHSSVPCARSSARREAFLDWNHSFMKSLGRELAQLTKTAEQDERAIAAMVDDLLEDTKRLVMLPFGTLLDLFPRQVRELAREQGKDIELVVQGREVEIDKRILEEMKDPLIHLVRNSIDHGLEKPEARVSKGKAPRGRLTMSVFQREAGKVEIVVLDDGSGIDVERVRAAAVKSGSISDEEAAHLPDEAALQFIFQSGVSTSRIITEISGRGLGMAIVREKVEKLGGQITIGTRAGIGTSFRILLPVTLATFKGILVRAGGQTFVLPTASVDRITRVKRHEVRTAEGKEIIALNGHTVPFARLADVLELPQPAKVASDIFVETVVLGSGDKRIAFGVDAVLNEQEVLVKNLGKPLLRVRNIAGATALGSGTPVLILSAPDLLKSAVKASAAGRAATAAEAGEAQRVRQILVADDSVTSRMLIKNILESAGYGVTTAVDGVDAFTTLQTRDFDLVVSDVEMPRLDGFGLTAKIRADKKVANLPVVLVTALAAREHRERGVDAGANAYIVKSSFDQSDLLDIIRKLI